MKLSIVIVSYNVKELLDKCLSSVQKSSGKIDCEIFVVDNNSQDGTQDLIKKKYPKVKLIANRENVGFSKANNQALKIAVGEYVLILNPDTELFPDTLNKMISFMDNSDGKVGVSTCKVELPNGQLDKDCRRSFPTPSRAFFHFTHISKLFKNSKIFNSYYIGYVSDEKEIEVDACVGAFMLIRNSVLKEVGLFDESFFFYGEDLDLCYRIKEKGYKIIYTPITKIIHHKGASSGIKKNSKEISKATKESKKRVIVESTRAMKIFYNKHYKNKYPILLTSAILFAISILKYLRIIKISLL